MADIAVLNVLLYSQSIGTLTPYPVTECFSPSTKTTSPIPTRPTLSLSFKDAFGALITDIKPTQTRLPPFFANLLPEGPMRDYLASQAHVKPTREFLLAWVLGHDLPGALRILSADGESLPPDDGQLPGGQAHANEVKLSTMTMVFCVFPWPGSN